VKVFSSSLASESGKAPEVFSTFTPYPGSQSGVSLATGLVEAGSGRESVVTAPGPGDAPLVKSFRWSLFTPTAKSQANGTATQGHSGKPTDPTTTSQFMAYDENYKNGVALSTGWVAGSEGGAMSIVTSQLAGEGKVRVWSSGSKLDGQPGMYLDNPNHHEEDVKYAEISSFVPFPGATPGVTVATSSTTFGADLLVAGMTPDGQEVRKYNFERPEPDAKTVAPKQIANLPVIPGVAAAAPLAGR